MQCSPMQCSPMQCSPMQCNPMQCNPMQCNPICSAVSCIATPCSATPCSAVPCSAVPCSAAPCSAAHAVQPNAVRPICICGVVSFEQPCPAYLFHVISISHGILANFWLMHVDLLIFKYNHTQFCFLAGILTNYYMMKHAVRLTCRLIL